MIDQLGGRKVVAALVILLVGVGVVAMKGDIPANMLALLQTLFGAMVLGNVAEHSAAAYVEGKKATAETTDVVDTIEELNTTLGARLGAMESKQDAQAQATAVTQEGVSVLLQYVQQATGR